MKKAFLLLSLVFVSISCIAQEELKDLRTLFFQQPQQAKAFIEKGMASVSQDPVVLGYKGAATAMSAQFKDWPHEKLSAFNEGKSLLEKSIEKNPWNAELRFIRLTLQCQSPSFLGYRSNIVSDCQLIIDHFTLNYVQVKDVYWQNVIKFILQQDSIEAAQKNKLQPYLT
jgi:hypothetical protein